jgi:hypothetical protein
VSGCDHQQILQEPTSSSYADWLFGQGRAIALAIAARTSAGTGWSFLHSLWHDALAGETGTPGWSK